MLYLLDASLLITAHATYYPVDLVPEYWAWLLHQAVRGRVKMPLEIFEEVREGPEGPEGRADLLFEWIRAEDVRSNLVLQESVDVSLLQHVIATGYAPDLTDTEVEQLGRDPFLVAYALANPAERVIVTAEVSKPSKRRQNRHLPDVCGSLGVRSCDAFALNRSLRFSTQWSSGR